MATGSTQTSPPHASVEQMSLPSRTPHETGAQLVQDLHTAFGAHHARAVHAKGVILEGSFEPSAEAQRLSRAALFENATAVTVRFSNFTGFPDIRDNEPGANPRGMAIKFGSRASPVLDIVAHNFNGFPTRTADEFGALLRAIGGSGPHVPAPTPLDDFLAGHPVAKAFLTSQHPAPLSYATTSYFGVNAVFFIDGDGRAQTVRHRFVPATGEQYFGPGEIPGSNYLQPEIAKRIAAGPVRFDWYAQIGTPDDLADDPSIAWPESRRLAPLGKILITALSSNTPEDDRSLTFLPGLMPDGISSADPMLAARTDAYPVSFRERQ